MKNTQIIFSITALFLMSVPLVHAQDTAKKKAMDTTRLNQVQVQAARPSQSITAVSLTTSDLNRSSGLSLQDALNLVPGVEMQNREPWGGDRIILRGYIPNLGSAANLSVNTGSGYGYMEYIDNIPVTDASGNTIMDDIDNSSLGGVQIIKGPASPLYGSYIGGSVHLFTPIVDPGTTSIQEQVIGGSYGLFRNNTTVETATANSSIWVNYGGQTYNGFRPNDFSKDQFAEFAGNFKTSTKNTISTYFAYDYSNQGLSGELDSDQVYGKQAIGDENYDNNFSHVSLESFRGGVTDKYQFNSHISNEATAFVTTRVIDQVIAHGYTDYNEGDWGGRDAFNFHYGIVDGTIGGSFQKLDETSDGFNVSNHALIGPFIPTNGSYSYNQYFDMNYNAFTQWSVKLPDGFSVTAGGSMNYSEYYIQNMANPFYVNNPTIYGGPVTSAFTPTGSIVKAFGQNVSVYASVGMGYTPPGVSNIVNSDNTIDLGLKPESAIQYELGSKGTLASSKFDYDIALYDLDITNRFIQEYINGIGTYTNAGEQRNMGVELSLGYNFITDKNANINQIRPWISYTYDDAKYVTFETYLKSKVTHGDSLTGNYSGNKAVGVAPNTANAGIDFGTKMGFYLHVTYQYVDKVPFTFDNQHYMSSYSLLNGRIGYSHTFGHWSGDAFVGINNALGSTYYTSVFFAANIQNLAQGTDPHYFNVAKTNIGTGGDGYILPAPYVATFYGGLTLKYTF